MTTPDREHTYWEVRAMLARAKADQIARLLRDLRETDGEAA